MSDSQTSSADRIKAIKEPWRKAIKQLSGPFNYEEIRNGMNSAKYWFKLPNKVLTFEGYIKLLAHLQNIRNDIVRTKMMIDEHAGFKIDALKNMEKILPGVFGNDECKTDKLREAKAAEELETFTIFTRQAQELQKMATSILNNIDSSIAQVNRQMKSVDMGIKTNAITTTTAKDWDEDNEEYDDEPLSGWNNSELDED